MTGETIKTLADYIAKLNQDNASLEHPEQYVNNETDTNGVAQDNINEVSSGAD